MYLPLPQTTVPGCFAAQTNDRQTRQLGWCRTCSSGRLNLRVSSTVLNRFVLPLRAARKSKEHSSLSLPLSAFFIWWTELTRERRSELSIIGVIPSGYLKYFKMPTLISTVWLRRQEYTAYCSYYTGRSAALESSSSNWPSWAPWKNRIITNGGTPFSSGFPTGVLENLWKKSLTRESWCCTRGVCRRLDVNIYTSKANLELI